MGLRSAAEVVHQQHEVGAGVGLHRVRNARGEHDGVRRVTAWLGLAGLLMPVGILGELYLGLSPVFVLLGAVAMTASVVMGGVLALRHWSDAAVTS